MLLHPRTPIIVGVVLTVLLVRLLMLHSPMPGDLSAPHAQIAGMSDLDGCVRCHDDAGLAEGCLKCHREIAAQFDTGEGYHHHLLEGKKLECGRCHAEHLGSDFRLVSEISWGAQSAAAFRHPHVAEFLSGKHVGLSCESCHAQDPKEPFTLTAFPSLPRPRTFLGRTQECISCHEDIHAGGLSGACDACHGEESFRPSVSFDHDVHFPLAGGHARVECKGCHLLPAADSPPASLPYPFHEARGTACLDCHQTPHIPQFPRQCDQCHRVSAPRWSSAIAMMTPELHALSGFSLTETHARVACQKCHPPDLPFDERYLDPSTPGYLRLERTCEGCHEDAHAGQFQERYPRCMDCHDSERFHPTHFGRDEHARTYPLTGAHEAVACTSCHRLDVATHVREFVGTTRACKECHEDPHGAQFVEQLTAADCTACHNVAADTFAIRPFDHKARTGFELLGAHARAACNSCHVETLAVSGAGTAMVRGYRDTPRECSSCHKDIHRGQFRKSGRTICSDCHEASSEWRDINFDHNTQSRFALEGVHATVACSRCHGAVKLDDGSEIIHYKPLGRECRDCHEIDRH